MQRWIQEDTQYIYVSAPTKVLYNIFEASATSADFSNKVKFSTLAIDLTQYGYPVSLMPYFLLYTFIRKAFF